MVSLPSDMVTYFAKLIEKESGIQYNAVNSHLLENRLHELSKIMGFADGLAFWVDVQARGLRQSERDMVLDIATNNETSFFRDPEVFDFFKDEFISKQNQTDATVRILCAACSTGQEPYSLAMIMTQLKEAGDVRRYEILATDLSERVLDQARQGIYSQLEVQRGLPALLLVRYFEQLNEGGKQLARFRIKPELAQHISFKRQNLIEPWQHKGPFDIIFCRNVLIYHDVANKRRIIARLAEMLVPGGYLVLGGAESVLGLSSDFEMQLHGKACVYRLRSAMENVV